MSQRNIIELLEDCLRENNPAEWAELIARLHPLVAGVVAKTARSCGITDYSIHDDLVQDTFLKLFKDDRESLICFHSETRSELDFFSYIKIIATNVVYDYGKSVTARKRNRSVEVYTDDPDTPPIDCPFVVDLLPIDIDRVFDARKVTPRDQTIFWLYYKLGYTAQEISQMRFALSTKGVEACLHRLLALLRERFSNSSAKSMWR